MIVIHHAILHILDFNSGVTVFSDQELDIDGSVETFLLKHIEKSFQDANLKTGIFYENSNWKRQLSSYLNSEVSFIEFSKTLSNQCYAVICGSEKLDSSDLLFLDLTIDGDRKIAFFKCNNRTGFVHQICQDESGIKNEIIHHYAILPAVSQKIDECAFIASNTLEIQFTDKKYTIDGQSGFLLADFLLECEYQPSQKESLKLVDTIAKKVAEDNNLDSIAAAVKTKNYLVEHIESDYLNPEDLSKGVFPAAPHLQQQYMEEMKTAGLPAQVKVEKELALRRGKFHRIKTDTGIEITIPIEYFENPDYIEFINHPNGTVSINLKNIAKLMNR